MKILVTGAAGFLGSHLVDSLLANGHEVIGIDSMIGGYEDNITVHPEYTFIRTDILNLDQLRSDLDECDAVYHCAALAYEGLSVFSPSLIVSNIITGSVNVMVSAIRCGATRFINCSSMARYGNAPIPYRETMRPEPVDPYGAAKLAAERQLDILGKTHGVKVIHAVPHNIIGPRQKYDDPYRNVASIMINRMLQGKQPVVYGDGMQQRCFSFVDDVLPTLLQMLDANVEHGEVFNVGPDEDPLHILGLARLLGELLNVEVRPIFAAARPCEVKAAICSSDKIRMRFGYRTRTTLESGLCRMIGYIRQRGVRPFDYNLPIELEDSPIVPEVWKDRKL